MKGDRTAAAGAQRPVPSSICRLNWGLKEETTGQSCGWGGGTLLPAGALISAGIRLVGFDGEEFGAGAQRSPQAPKGWVSFSSPRSQEGPAQGQLFHDMPGGMGKQKWGPLPAPAPPAPVGRGTTPSSLQLPELRVPPAGRSIHQWGETLLL